MERAAAHCRGPTQLRIQVRTSGASSACTREAALKALNSTTTQCRVTHARASTEPAAMR